jgi:dihydrodipicolinate reductase
MRNKEVIKLKFSKNLAIAGLNLGANASIISKTNEEKDLIFDLSELFENAIVSNLKELSDQLPLKIGIVGFGRIISYLANLILDLECSYNIKLSTVFVKKEEEGKSLLELSKVKRNKNSNIIEVNDSVVRTTNSIDELFAASDIIIDFSSKNMMLEIFKKAVAVNKTIVSGVGGVKLTDIEEFEPYSRHILHTHILSYSIAIIAEVIEQISSILPKEWKISVMDRHGITKPVFSNCGKKWVNRVSFARSGKEVPDVLFKEKIERNKPGAQAVIASIEASPSVYSIRSNINVASEHKIMITNSDGREILIETWIPNPKVFAVTALLEATSMYLKKEELSKSNQVKEIVKELFETIKDYTITRQRSYIEL